MTSSLTRARATRIGRLVVLTTALVAGAGLAMLAGFALAKTFTLNVAKNGKVTPVGGTTMTEPIVVNSHGIAVYELSGDTVHHPLCTSSNGCYKFWPPVTVSSARSKLTAAPGVKGKLGRKRLGASSFQVTLNGRPLYTFAADNKKKATATGQGIQGFGGTWHVVRAAVKSSTTSTGTTTTSPTTTTTCAYPPYC
jgi:predicted lipoprotein with Yx(FWY)xxD motif